MKILVFILSSFMLNNLFAQDTCPCCKETYLQFNFWLGDWIVFDTLGNEVGQNSIRKKEDRCILLEEWRESSGSTGSSINYYNRIDSTWYQTWVDNQGNVLNLKGKTENDCMILTSELSTSDKIGEYYNQVTWKPNTDGSVSQIWKILDKDYNLIQVAFFGIYRRKE